jgi:hypothetical protein
VARRALDEPHAQPRLQPLELEAHRGLRGAQGVGGAGEAAQFGDADEGLDGVEVEGAVHHFKKLSLICCLITC